MRAGRNCILYGVRLADVEVVGAGEEPGSAAPREERGIDGLQDMKEKDAKLQCTQFR